MYVGVRVTVSTGPKKRGGITCPLTRNRPLKHHPSGVFAPHDRCNFLDAVQKHMRSLLLSFWSVVNGFHHCRSRSFP